VDAAAGSLRDRDPPPGLPRLRVKVQGDGGGRAGHSRNDGEDVDKLPSLLQVDDETAPLSPLSPMLVVEGNTPAGFPPGFKGKKWSR
jgi:hypothetical protein